jgi:hypothetical protein
VVGQPARQQRALAAIADRVAGMPEIAGAILVGSNAGGVADAASDVDLIICPVQGQFEAAWQRRHDVHGPQALACWDDRQDAGEVGAHRWVTDDMVLVEALFATPASRARLAPPWRMLVGGPEVARALTPRPPIDRSEFRTEGAHPVDQAFEDLKWALRSMGQVSGG